MNQSCLSIISSQRRSFLFTSESVSEGHFFIRINQDLCYAARDKPQNIAYLIICGIGCIPDKRRPGYPLTTLSAGGLI